MKKYKVIITSAKDVKLLNDKISIDINYLCKLANKIELIKNINKEKKAILVPLPNYIDWQEERHLGVTVTDASVRIQAYKKIIRACNFTFLLCNIPQI